MFFRLPSHCCTVRPDRFGHPTWVTIDVWHTVCKFALDTDESLRGAAHGKGGLCKDCKWWQIEPHAAVESLTLGLCIEEKLQPFWVRVSGNSGCNRFMPGKAARAKGSGEAPPAAGSMK
jgi:hypothetical protein